MSDNHSHHKHDEHDDHDEHSRHHDHHSGHGHSHGLVDESIIRSKEGVKAVSWSFLALLIAAVLQAVLYLSSHSIALLADLIHNAGDALTAIPLGLAFFFKSKKGEKWAGYSVVLVIFISALLTLYQVVDRFIHPQEPSHILYILIAGIIGILGNEIAAVIRWRTGKRINSPALIADGNHARADGLVSLGVVVGAIFLAVGLPIADPIIGLIISGMILHSTWQSWITIRQS